MCNWETDLLPNIFSFLTNIKIINEKIIKYVNTWLIFKLFIIRNKGNKKKINKNN